MPKKVIVLSGVSGTGKTHARLHDPELKNLPCVDIADVYREFPEFSWYEALPAMLKRMRKELEEHDTVIVEGYFLPGTRSRNALDTDLRVAGVDIEYRFFWAPFEVCQERIAAQWERGEISDQECRGRISLLKKCWRPAT